MNRSRFTSAIIATSLVALTGTVASADLLGVEPGLPQIFFDNQGVTTYNASSDVLSVVATPVAIRFASDVPPVLIGTTGDPPAKILHIEFLVSEDGTVGGGSGSEDLMVVGRIDENGDGTPDFEGILLTGEILEFGFLNQGGGASGPTDVYDFRFLITGGSLAAALGAQHAGVVVTSDESSFTGVFTSDFAGKAKGPLGPIPVAGAVGACCLPDGSCSEIAGEECADLGGIFQGDGTPCLGEPCDAILFGACCVEEHGDDHGDDDDGDCPDDDDGDDDGNDGDDGDDDDGDHGDADAHDGDDDDGGDCPDDDDGDDDDGDDDGAAEDGDDDDGDGDDDDGDGDDDDGDGGGASCFLTTEADCLAEGGVYQGDGTICLPDTCVLVTGACCLPGDDEDDDDDGGDDDDNGDDDDSDGDDDDGDGDDEESSHDDDGGGDGDDDDEDDDGGHNLCEELTPFDCAVRGGEYQGDGTTCDASCTGAVEPILPSTRGRLKAGDLPRRIDRLAAP